MLFPEFSTFNVNGPLKLTFYPTEKDDKFLFRSSIDLTKADVYVPAIALKKVKGKYGSMKIKKSRDLLR